MFFATEKGLVKKVKLEAFNNVRRSGLIAIKIKGDDKLIWAKPTKGKNEIQLITSLGQAIRFSEKDVRHMGRATKGVKGINIKLNDYVVTMETFPSKESKPDDKRKKYFRDSNLA